MCGLAGFVGEGDRGTLQNMLSVIQHRGPDAQGIWNDQSNNIWFGHQRLSILDIEGGSQPFQSEDRELCIIYNGEIYNHAALRKRLEQLGHRFVSDHSDTEVILLGYRQWGQNVVDHLNGMWAFAIYDRDKQTILLSRDRFGKKPLFYSLSKKGLVFASELTATFAHPLVDRVVDRDALKQYFANGYVPSPGSLIKSVAKLDAGCNMLYSVTSGKSKINRYWRFEAEPDESTSELQWQEELREKLFQATQSRMMADVPVGVLLSGGIDSSSVISMAVNSTQLSNVNSYSIGFTDNSFDESGFSQEISQILGTRHTVKVLDENNILDVAREVVSMLDEPMADSSLVPSFLLAKLAANDVKVVLGGDGSDELFAGYDPFRALSYAKIYSLLVPGFIHKLFRSGVDSLPVSHQNMSLDFILKRTLAGLSYPKSLWNPAWLGVMEPSKLGKLFGEKITAEQVYQDANQSWEACSSNNIYDRSMQFYIEQYMKNSILPKIDRAGMMNSLEVRSPYLDIDFVDVVRRIPASLKYKNGETKYILKKSLNPVLPLDILYRKKKGFGMPIGKWFKEGVIGTEFALDGDYYDKDFMNRIYARHHAGSSDNRMILWAFWVFEMWRKKWQVRVS